MAILVPALLRCPGVCVRAYGGGNTAGEINFSVIGWGRISNLGWRRGAGPPLGETRREVEGRPGGARRTRQGGCWGPSGAGFVGGGRSPWW